MMQNLLCKTQPRNQMAAAQILEFKGEEGRDPYLCVAERTRFCGWGECVCVCVCISPLAQ